MTLYFGSLQVMSELIKDITRNVAFHGSVRHRAILCELLKEAQGAHSVLGEFKRGRKHGLSL